MYLLLIVIIIVYLWWALHEVICEDLIDRQFSKKDCINHSFFPLCIFYFFCIPICHCVFVFVLYSAKVWLMRCCVGNLGPFSLGSEFVSIINVVFFSSSIMPSSSGEPSNYTLCILSVKRRGQSLLDGLAKSIKMHNFHFDSNWSSHWILWMYVTPLILLFRLSRNVNFQFVVEVWQCSLCSLC